MDKYLIIGIANKTITDSRTGKTLFTFDDKGQYVTEKLYIAGLCSRKFKVTRIIGDVEEPTKELEEETNDKEEFNEYEDMDINSLRKLAKEMNIPADGKKVEIIERIMEAKENK